MNENETKVELLKIAERIVCAGPVDLPEKRAERLKEIYRQLVALFNEQL